MLGVGANEPCPVGGAVRMMLTDKDKRQGDELGLTYTAMSVALEIRIPPETYAERKRGLLTERDAWEAKMTQV